MAQPVRSGTMPMAMPTMLSLMTMALDAESDDDGNDGRRRVIAMPMLTINMKPPAIIIWGSRLCERDEDDDPARNFDGHSVR
jgi:hypothetical protein